MTMSCVLHFLTLAQELEELVAACEDHADEELEAELVIALLNTQMLKACDSIEMMDGILPPLSLSLPTSTSI